MTSSSASVRSRNPRVALTMGDPAGVGPELCLQACRNDTILAECVPVIFGDVGVLRRVADACQLGSLPAVIELVDWPTVGPKLTEPAILNVAAIEAATVTPGHVDSRTGAAAYAYLRAAITAAKQKDVQAICTAPIHKEALHAAGLPYPGHTEILAAETGSLRNCMVLTSEEITCALVTTHIGLAEVASQLSTERILEVMELTAEARERLRGRPPGRGGCGGDRPAGEGGRCWQREAERLIRPAIEQARQRGLDVIGPLPPDTAFVPTLRSQTDAYICMYHDQGLIPLKAIAFDTAVNVTLGLSIVRTSVDHGTALDIAWQGTASGSSMRQAVLLAARLSADISK